jgi:succinate dehydrogenase / fumarate reductase cytochrome b subunit
MYQKRPGFIGHYFKEINLNPNVGTWSWFLHRIAGVVLFLYIFPHFLVTSSYLLTGSAQGFDSWLGKVQTPLFHFLEIFLVAAVAFHLLNGLRIILADFFFMTKQHKGLLWVAMIIFVLVMILTVIMFVPRISAG